MRVVPRPLQPIRQIRSDELEDKKCCYCITPYMFDKLNALAAVALLLGSCLGVGVRTRARRRHLREHASTRAADLHEAHRG